MSARWVVARTSGKAHLDLGERSAQSLRVQAKHIIVTACRAHIDANAQVVPETYHLRCSNCLRISRLKRHQEKQGTRGPISTATTDPA